MSQEKNNKKKLLTYYLILGACILLIAAVTVTVVFAVRNNGNSFEIDNGGTTDDGNQDEDGDDEDDDDQPTDDVSSAYEFIAPVSVMDVINDYTFYYNKTLDCYHYHTGLDMAAEAGTEVVACVDGTVESINVGDLLDGTKVVLSHADGVKTSYYFIDAAEGLEVGDTVKRGDVIGTVAEPAGSEYKEGAHLHFEVSKNGETVDPNEYLDISEK
ncbi:MAG TPA: M23 family metallopeptidase [Candidatus Coproplasma excrementipullorum]|nr:M23 family metallopeptidase [Candidatus Coproplasma excrementipullorum]